MVIATLVPLEPSPVQSLLALVWQDEVKVIVAVPAAVTVKFTVAISSSVV